MPEISYSPSKAPFDPARDLLGGHRFAIIVPIKGVFYLLHRTRSNGQTFTLTYKDEAHARRGLGVARAHFAGAEIYDDQG